MDIQDFQEIQTGVVAIPPHGVSPIGASYDQPTNTFEKWVNVTSELADYWLEHLNACNRNIKPAHVTRIARQMYENKFNAATNTIYFNVEGKLMGGQHRLKAISVTRLTQRMKVMWGFPAEYRYGLNDQVPDTLSDALAQQRIDHPKQTAALARQLCLVLNHSAPGQLSYLEMWEILDGFPNWKDIMLACITGEAKTTNYAIFQACCVIAAMKLGKEKIINDWIPQVQRPNNISSEDPRSILNRNTLFNKGRLGQNSLVEARQVFKALYKYAHGLTVSRLREASELEERYFTDLAPDLKRFTRSFYAGDKKASK